MWRLIIVDLLIIIIKNFVTIDKLFNISSSNNQFKFIYVFLYNLIVFSKMFFKNKVSINIEKQELKKNSFFIVLQITTYQKMRKFELISFFVKIRKIIWKHLFVMFESIFSRKKKYLINDTIIKRWNQQKKFIEISSSQIFFELTFRSRYSSMFSKKKRWQKQTSFVNHVWLTFSTYAKSFIERQCSCILSSTSSSSTIWNFSRVSSLS